MVLVAACLAAASLVFVVPAAAEVPEGAKVVSTSRVTLDSRHSDAQADAAEAALDSCQQRNVECDYGEPRIIETFENEEFTFDGQTVTERVPVQHEVTIVTITVWEWDDPDPEPEPEPWTPETSGCSQYLLTRHLGKEIRCGSTINVPTQRAQTGSVSRPRPVYRTVVVSVDHDDNPDTPDVNRTKRVPHYPVVTSTLGEDCAPQDDSVLTAVYPYADYGLRDLTDEEELTGLFCDAPAYRYSRNSFIDAQQYSTLRSITTPPAFDYNDYIGGDGEWSQQEIERSERAWAIHEAQWDAYDQALAQLRAQEQPFWICEHDSQTLIRHQLFTPSNGLNQCELHI